VEKVIIVRTEGMNNEQTGQLSELVGALRTHLTPGVRVYEDWYGDETWGGDQADITFYTIADREMSATERRSLDEVLDELGL
jgi:dTDP-4-dehydrorhamnose reductase